HLHPAVAVRDRRALRDLRRPLREGLSRLAQDRDRRAGSHGVIRVVVIGSESTGKSELARALAAHYGTAWAAEYVRDYMDAKGGALDADDVEPIARGQIARE